MTIRVIHTLAALTLVVTPCTSSSSHPAEFESMSSDEVGCIIHYGNSDPYVVGPFGPSDSEEITPNDYTSIRVGWTASEIVVVATVPGGGGNTYASLNDMPTDGIVARRSFSNGGDPGYVVTCWRGDGWARSPRRSHIACPTACRDHRAVDRRCRR